MIQGIVTRPVRKFLDERGWLAELIREDDLHEIPRPAMSYVSMTLPNVARGPHEHAHQTDVFCFLGPSNFKLALWDNRKDSATYEAKMTLYVGADNPLLVVVPPGVVHGYKNIGTEPGMVLNFPDKLYKGPGRKQDVDEIRHENDPHSPFRLE